MVSNFELNVPSKSKIESAGEIIRTNVLHSDDEINNYLKAYNEISKWANLYAIPLKYFQISIKRRITKNLKLRGYVIGQRLKRMPSIIGKILRFKDMNVSQMQDIGGLRIVVQSLSDVEIVHNEIVRARRKGVVSTFKDYIANPKADGYRGIHQVFKYYQNDYPQLYGYKIEVQIRTRLQHCWATAVETLGMINSASYKTGDGDELTRRFFLLTSGLIAIKENCPLPEPIKNMSLDAIKSEILKIDSKLQIFRNLSGIAVSIHNKKFSEKEYYYLLELSVDPGGKGRIHISSFLEEQRVTAESVYRQRELDTREDKTISVLLIRADKFKDIKKAYPNYFLDVKTFLTIVSDYLNNRQ